MSDDALDPLKLFEYDHNPGNYSLILSDNHMVEHHDVFAARGFEGGGYDWEAVARQVVRAKEPALDGKFKYDPEAGMFTAYGTDREALAVLGSWLKRALQDKDLLTELVNGADEDWFD